MRKAALATSYREVNQRCPMEICIGVNSTSAYAGQNGYLSSNSGAAANLFEVEHAPAVAQHFLAPRSASMAGSLHGGSQCHSDRLPSY